MNAGAEISMAVFKMPGIMKEQEKRKNRIECHHLYPMCVIYTKEKNR